jgi:hypothetical protein
MEGNNMEKFESKYMNDTQVDEIVELMDGEHGETLELWRKENYNHGQAIGMVGGTLFTLLIAGCAKLAVDFGKSAWNLGKGYVKFVKDNT